MIIKHVLASDPPWLKAAFKDLGLKEIRGARDNPRIVEMFALAGHSWVDDDETAWCAAAVGAWLVETGYRGTGSLMARSYLRWGKKTRAKRGAIMVLPRGKDPRFGHVAIVLGVENGRVYYIGGNQKDTVNIMSTKASRVLDFRWPETAKNSVTVKANVGGGSALVGAEGIEEVQTLLTDAHSQTAQYMEYLTYAKWAFIAIGIALLGFGVYRFLNRHIWTKKTAPDYLAPSPIPDEVPYDKEGDDEDGEEKVED